MKQEWQEGQQLLLNKHKWLIRTCMGVLPGDYAVFQTSRPTLLYFLLSSLDLLGQIDLFFNHNNSGPQKVVSREEVIDWIYSLQLTAHSTESSEKCGFRGWFADAAIFRGDGEAADACPSTSSSSSPLESAHLAQTYTSLCSLLILGDDLSRVDRQAVLEAVRKCQCQDGSFFATGDQQSENDMRFIFCAAAICYILDDLSPIDLDSLGSFIRRSVGYDGGIAQGPGLESHGGSTFCAVASLSLVGRLWDESVLTGRDIERLKGWAVMRQRRGFHGRANKPDDSCYSFWLGATLTLLNAQSLVNWAELRTFLAQMQDNTIGGFCKSEESSHSDLLHTYFSLAAFGIFGEPLVRPLFPALNISLRAHEHLENVVKREARRRKRTVEEKQHDELN